MIYPAFLRTCGTSPEALITVQRGEISPTRYQLPRNYLVAVIAIFLSAPRRNRLFRNLVSYFRIRLFDLHYDWNFYISLKIIINYFILEETVLVSNKFF